MREPHAIMRSVLRSYALRGLIGFGVCGAVVRALETLLVELLGKGNIVSAWLIVAPFIVLSVLGCALAGWMLIDENRRKQRNLAALLFGLLVWLYFVAGAALISLVAFRLVGLFLPKSSTRIISNFLAWIPPDGSFGGAFGAALGFGALYLRRHMKIRAVHGFWVWLAGFAAFTISGITSFSILFPSDSFSRPEWSMGSTRLIATFALGGLLFGLGLDLCNWFGGNQERKRAATPAELEPTPKTPQDPDAEKAKSLLKDISKKP